MDIVLLPVHSGEPKFPGLFSPEGMARLDELIQWLVARSARFDAYVVLPDQPREVVESFLNVGGALAAAVPGVTRFVLDLKNIDGELFDRIRLCGMSGVILLASRFLNHDAEAQRALSAYFQSPRSKHLEVGLWMDGGEGEGRVARLRAFERAGIEPRLVTEPRLPLSQTSLAGFRAENIPAELLDKPMPCAINANTFTVNADGDVRACTRYPASGLPGNLFQHAPEDLMYRKGWMSGRIVSSDTCRCCAAPGRSLWPHRQAGDIARMIQFAADAGERYGSAADQWIPALASGRGVR